MNTIPKRIDNLPTCQGTNDKTKPSTIGKGNERVSKFAAIFFDGMGSFPDWKPTRWLFSKLAENFVSWVDFISVI